jgi:hypothetical protein
MRTALLLVLLSGTAAAQTQQPTPQAPARAEQTPAASSRPLNLKLDGRAADYTREAPREDAKAGDSLPGLGEGAIQIQNIPTQRSETVRTPYPNMPETSR